ncbi:response regulator [candidate division KSB1 bacterium]|nr:response regulator [candidate division KSB1 bacterium]
MLPVLLVEDDEDIRTLAEWSLRSTGLAVVACQSGRQALQELELRAFALVILDMMMPDMSGCDVMREMHSRFDGDAPPVAIFSARPRDVIMRDCAGLHVAAILSKPFEPVEFSNQVHRLVEQQP